MAISNVSNKNFTGGADVSLRKPLICWFYITSLAVSSLFHPSIILWTYGGEMTLPPLPQIGFIDHYPFIYLCWFFFPLISRSLNMWRRNLSICTLINAEFIKLCVFGNALDILKNISVFWQYYNKSRTILIFSWSSYEIKCFSRFPVPHIMMLNPLF